MCEREGSRIEGVGECLCAHAQLCFLTKRPTCLSVHDCRARRGFCVFLDKQKDSSTCCPDMLPKNWHPPLMPTLAFISPRNTPDTVINSLRL